MKIEDSREIKTEKDLFDSLIILWKNKWQLILILVISLALGSVIYYVLSNKFPLMHESTINILVEENPYYVIGDPIESEARIIQRMNILLSSSYNYEKWSNDNKSITKHLSQVEATGLKIVQSTQTLVVEYSSQETLTTLTSYLAYTAKLVSDKILAGMKRTVNIILEQRKAITDAYQLKLAGIENEVQKEIVEQKAAQNTETELGDPSEAILLHKLTLLYALEVNRLYRGNRKYDFSVAENEYYAKLGEIDGKIEELNIKINSGKQTIRLGNITSSAITGKNLWSIILIFSAFIGLVVGIFYVFFKTEYRNRQNT